VEVLLLTDRVDEWVVGSLNEFQGKQLQSVAKGDLDLGKLEDEAEKKEQEQEAEQFKALITRIKEALGEKVQEVRITHRLTDSPACLVSDQYGMSMNLERLLKAAGQKVGGSKPILEVNVHHPLVQSLDKQSERGRFRDWCLILFDQALLAEARIYVQNGQLDKAAENLRNVMEHTSDAPLALAARLRLARVQLAQNKPDDARATLDAQKDPGAFKGRYHEARGDILLSKGDKAGALTEYKAAVDGADRGTLDGDLLQLKIKDLSGEVPKAEK